uniref:Uncharacterized protein n=1 Tax=Aegilops tauschii subsp. strangulata TaxID=200361 RepID=A0A453R528_AEGTS
RSLSSATRSLALEPLAHRHRRLSVARVAGASTPHAAPPPLPLASSPPFHGCGDLRRLDLKRGCSTFLRVAGISGSLRMGRARPPAAAAGRMGTASATSSATSSASQGQGTAARTAGQGTAARTA